MTDELMRILEPVEGLRGPVLLAAFVRKNGVNSTAAAILSQRLRDPRVRAVAEVDAQTLFDFTQTRPQVRVRDGVRSTTWPENRVHLAPGGEAGHDALIVAGQEPHLQWPAFSDSLVEYAKACGVESGPT